LGDILGDFFTNASGHPDRGVELQIVELLKIIICRMELHISHITNAYSLRRGRRLPPTSEVEELQFVIVM
jgi:hypothetical protein